MRELNTTSTTRVIKMVRTHVTTQVCLARSVYDITLSSPGSSPSLLTGRRTSICARSRGTSKRLPGGQRSGWEHSMQVPFSTGFTCPEGQGLHAVCEASMVYPGGQNMQSSWVSPPATPVVVPTGHLVLSPSEHQKPWAQAVTGAEVQPERSTVLKGRSSGHFWQATAPRSSV